MLGLARKEAGWLSKGTVYDTLSALLLWHTLAVTYHACCEGSNNNSARVFGVRVLWRMEMWEGRKVLQECVEEGGGGIWKRTVIRLVVLGWVLGARLCVLNITLNLVPTLSFICESVDEEFSFSEALPPLFN